MGFFGRSGAVFDARRAARARGGADGARAAALGDAGGRAFGPAAARGGAEIRKTRVFFAYNAVFGSTLRDFWRQPGARGAGAGAQCAARNAVRGARRSAAAGGRGERRHGQFGFDRRADRRFAGAFVQLFCEKTTLCGAILRALRRFGGDFSRTVGAVADALRRVYGGVFVLRRCGRGTAACGGGLLRTGSGAGNCGLRRPECGRAPGADAGGAARGAL